MAGSFDKTVVEPITTETTFQSLWSMAGSFDIDFDGQSTISLRFNPFGAGQGLSTRLPEELWSTDVFQSLWSRAGSFDIFEQFKNYYKRRVSIPLEQGRVFRLDGQDTFVNLPCFNPFGAGQGLSTAGVVWCLDG